MKIAVLGAGRMGRWLVDNLSGRHEVCVYDIKPILTKGIKSVRILEDYGQLKGFNPELIINAVSLTNTIRAFELALPHLSQNCILSDVASVKGIIPDFYKKASFRFASVHPMFGPTFAGSGQISDENAIIITESDKEGALFFRRFFSSLGLKIYEYSFDRHDRMIAYSLTLPFASTMVFAACMKTTAVPGTTFKKHLEIARGLLSEDDILLSEILFNTYSLPQLEKVTSRLDFLKHVIKEKDSEEAARFFNCLRKNILED